jgi:methionyl-tRNA formyltransferase
VGNRLHFALRVSYAAPKTVVLLGKGELAIAIAQYFAASEGYELAAVVPVVPEPEWTPALGRWARGEGVTVVESGRFDDLPQAAGDGPIADLAFSCFYELILPAWFIARCGRILNLHNGPLPRYRGVAPINWALKNEEIEHGVTIHEITPGIDDGPIVAQLKYSIYPEIDEVATVYARALAYGKVLFEQTMPLLDEIHARPQDEGAALYYNGAQRALLDDRRDFTRERSRERSG